VVRATLADAQIQCFRNPNPENSHPCEVFFVGASKVVDQEKREEGKYWPVSNFEQSQQAERRRGNLILSCIMKAGS
jgi:hypothetical protein